MASRVPKPLDVFNVPLQGMQLVEAAAGTGKTWTITALYVRLVLEHGVPVDRILVVTYTTAATEELRERIRARLAEVRTAFTRGAGGDAFCLELLARHVDRAAAISRLTQAIIGFDEAAIFTIHGFCQRALTESAFESAMPFETEILTDQRELLQEVVDDFWRRDVYPADPLFAQYLLDRCATPDAMAKAIGRYTGKPYLRVIAPEPGQDLDALDDRYCAAYAAVHALWYRCRDEIGDLLLRDDALNRTRYSRRKIPTWLVNMNAFLAVPVANLRVFSDLERFTPRSLAASVKKGGSPPKHPFFEACETLLDAHAALTAAFDTHYTAFKARALQYVQQQLSSRKRERQVQSYDDLLTNLQEALAGPMGRALAHKLRTDYQTALIDEFQDTDPVQYDIFERVFATTDQPVFLVGDPKQAIYSFRGADIFTYLNARKSARRQYTLDVNWRSVPALVTAVNTLFCQEVPFVFDEIGFHSASAADTPHALFSVGDTNPPPLTIWLLERGDSGKLITKGRATEACVVATAGEIATLLSAADHGQVRIGDQALRAGDIAVLVRTHQQGRRVSNALLALGVPSVQHAQDNVFKSWEAMELERVLMAVAEPANEALVKAALVTDMLGMKADALLRLQEDAEAWDQRVETFHTYHRSWREHGFIQMLRRLMDDEGVTTRLLVYQDGERRLTNLLHLAELLQETASSGKAGMEALVKWFADMRHTESGDSDHAQLRLESDADRVKIVTVHKSKGLQFPVVFCPFLWDGKVGANKAQEVLFHDRSNNFGAALDLGSEQIDVHRRQAAEEELAESLRLLYVALTRAQCRCYLTWGAINEAGTSAPAWLFHRPVGLRDENILEVLKAHFNTLSDGDIRAQLQRLAETAPGSIRVESLPESAPVRRVTVQAAASALQARKFPGRIARSWRVSSFSALATGHETEAPDHDACARHEARLAGKAYDVFSFPRGARAGTCLHTIFEHIDFATRDPAHVTQTVRRQLHDHGFADAWTPAVAQMVANVLLTPLDAMRQLRLADIGRSRRVDEMEFYYPIADLTDAGLRALLARHGFGGQLRISHPLDRLTFAPVNGFMHGFIDLIFEADGRFYLVDYKSNWLGMDYADYGNPLLAAVMMRESYYLQYLIYAAALHRHLRQRLSHYDYDAHFGGIFYLFLRGMHPDKGPDSGIYRDRPQRGLIETLDAYFNTGVWTPQS